MASKIIIVPRFGRPVRMDFSTVIETLESGRALVVAKSYGKVSHEKQRARRKVRSAVLKGIIKKPHRCSCCEKRGRVNGHHSDYSKPLDVTWLCSSCHARAHISINRLAA